MIKGIPPESIGDFRSLVSDRLPDYDLASGPDNSFTLTMKPSIVKDTKTKAVQQAIETIRNRIDQLGVSEPVIQEHGLGDYQILVQLPGVDDPARVKEIMQSTAMLEIRQAIGGPYTSEQEAMQANGGIASGECGADERQEHRRAVEQRTRSQYWVISRASAVSGSDLADGRTRDATRTGVRT